MPQMLRKIKPARTIHRRKEMGDSITKTEVEVTRSSLKGSAMIKRLGATQRDLDFPAECAQRPLTQTY